MSFFDDAACKGKKTNLWFALPAGNQYLPISRARQRDDIYAYPRSICRACPVHDECLRYALDLARQGETVTGMWGGLDEIERAVLLRREREAVGVTPCLPTEPNVVLSIARAAATRAEAPRPPWGNVSARIGGTPGSGYREGSTSTGPSSYSGADRG